MRALTGLLFVVASGTAGCVHLPTLYAPLQPDGWSAQPMAMSCRFAPDASLDPGTLMPVGDEGYYLYVLTKVGSWDYSSTRAYLSSHARQPWGHSWLILESPEARLECGLNGNFGLEKPTYGTGVSQGMRDGARNPISYLWETMTDGEIELGNGGRTPSFVWRMPITRLSHQRVYEHVMHWKYGQISVRTNNCIDLVTEAAALAGINLMHRVRLTFPPDIRILGKTRHIWTDPQYSALEYSTPDILEVDLRHLARFGIGRDSTDWYLNSRMAAPPSKDRGKAAHEGGARAEDGL